MKSMLHLGRLVLVLLGFVAAARAVDAPVPDAPGVPVATVVVPDGLNAAAVQQAILRAGAGRGWTAKEKGEGKVVLFLEHGGWRSTLTFEYDPRDVKIFSSSAKLDRKGRPKKYAVPERWVEYLKLDLGKFLGEAAAKS